MHAEKVLIPHNSISLCPSLGVGLKTHRNADLQQLLPYQIKYNHAMQTIPSFMSGGASTPPQVSHAIKWFITEVHKHHGTNEIDWS